jgi:dihydrofolate reductase
MMRRTELSPMTGAPTLLLSLAITLDGFVADAEGGVGWLDPFMSPDLGFEEFMAKVGVLVMGRTTYERVLTFGPWPYAGKWTVVLTHRPLTSAPEGVEGYGAEPETLTAKLKETTKGTIWHMGGGRSAQPFLDRGLVDELELNLIPVTLGRGVPLFQKDAKALALSVVEHQVYSSGIVRLRYRVARAVADPANQPAAI